MEVFYIDATLFIVANFFIQIEEVFRDFKRCSRALEDLDNLK
jgi:hypothetical protein